MTYRTTDAADSTRIPCPCQRKNGRHYVRTEPGGKGNSGAAMCGGPANSLQWAVAVADGGDFNPTLFKLMMRYSCFSPGFAVESV